MREAKDICHICAKVDPTPSMTYMDLENPHDDRLVCDECVYLLCNKCVDKVKEYNNG